MVEEHEFHLWGGDDNGNNGFEDSGDIGRLLYGNNDNESNELGFEVNQRIIYAPKRSRDQDEMARKLMQLHPLGLHLSITPNLMNSIMIPNYTAKVEAGTTSESSGDQSRTGSDFGLQLLSEKLKASNFAATFIRIGSWERKSRNEGDLVAKCYFAKKKLVWELLKGGLKSKIEIQWNDIIGINASMLENQLGILQIELNEPPTFHEETDPQPRKHTIWKPASDFTGGQASICRRHFLTFPAGYLDKHYEKLLLNEPRLFELSKQSFPTLKNPYFRSKFDGCRGISFDFNRSGQDIHPGMQFSFPNFPPRPVQTQHAQPYGHAGLSSFKEIPSPSSVMDFSPSDSCSFLENQRIALWGQGMSNYTDSLARNQGLAPDFPSTVVHPAVPLQNYNLTSSGQGAEINSYAAKALSDLENQLLSDMQVGSYDERCHVQRVLSLNQLVNLNEKVNPESNNASQETFYSRDSSAEDSLFFSTGENFSGQFYEQQPATSMPQIHTVNPLMPQQWNNLPYNCVNNPNLTIDEFGHVKNFNSNWR
ncbi:hypothetical protein OIU74_026318 [Salix koriyanagi]|uniref:TRF2/HOY1 PH-like domain-containing protein n=1 Tax=Salix koriyanagi TaxID=2511006 RepID=A0A9Q0VXX5_9ROSI|nr:hypothetical protein OIU74_026318 [Salix koriyanagi]